MMQSLLLPRRFGELLLAIFRSVFRLAQAPIQPTACRLPDATARADAFLSRCFLSMNYPLRTPIFSPNNAASSRQSGLLNARARTWQLAVLAVGWLTLAAGSSAGKDAAGVLLPDGSEFVFWEQPLEFSRTYYVDNQNPRAADSNPGTHELPFRTINHAAQVLQPDERVLIMAGVYRERVDPARGGIGPTHMISYEAAPGAKVIVKGSRLVKSGWKPSTEYGLGPSSTTSAKPKIYQRALDDLDFHGYNPFGMVNMMQDRIYLNPKPEELRAHLLRRGMVFVDGRRLEQVELYSELAQKDGTFWCEHDGLTIHVRLPGDADPAQHEIELVIQEQVFAPRTRGLNFIRVKGITFEQAANAFPDPQRGMVSASRGTHWIIEDCVLRQANSMALDIGAQGGGLEEPAVVGHSIVRQNHITDIGMAGIEGLGVQSTLIESNLIEHVGWQDVELTWEAGGIKLHLSKSCLLRNNVIRHLTHCGAIWLDYENVNTRVTGNVIGDTLETLRGGLYIEASHEANMFDHNIIWKATEGHGGSAFNYPPHGGWGITLDGTDGTVIAHNLIGYMQDAAIKMRTTEGRIVGTRGGTTRNNQILNNIFYRCGKAIEFPNQANTADGNLYSKQWTEGIDKNQSVGRGLNWIPDSGAILRLDLEAWQKFFGFDKHGAYADMNIDVDLDALTMTWSVAGRTPDVNTEKRFERDLLGEPAGKVRKAGPLLHLPGTAAKVSIDPRTVPHAASTN
jgi:hypothetical protein